MRLRKLFSKKILIVFIVIVVAGGALLTLPALLLDADALRGRVAAQAKALTGHDLAIKGAVDFQLMPSPTLTLRNVELQPAADSGPSIPHLRADSLVIRLPWRALIAETPLLHGMTLVQPVLEIHRTTEGIIQWDWLRLPPNNAGLPAALTVENGKLLYLDASGEHIARVENIAFQLTQTPQGLGAAGHATTLGHTINLQARLPALREGQDSQLELKVWQSERTLLSAMLTRMQAQPEEAVWSGTLGLQIENMHQWLPKPTPAATAANSPLYLPGQPAPEQATAPYPVALAAALEYRGGALKLNDMTLELPDSVGKGEASATFAEIPAVSLRMGFERLRIDPSLLNRIFSARLANQLSYTETSMIEEAQPRLPKNIVVDFDFTVQDLFLDTRQFTDATLTGSLKEAEFSITNFQTRFASDSTIVLSGKIADTAKGIRLQGKTQTSGQDLRHLLSVFDPGAERLPEKGFGEYFVEANIFVSPEQLRLSEAVLKVGELELLGGMVTYFEEKPRVDAEIALRNINLDHFRDTWREEVRTAGIRDFIFKINSTVDFSWLRALKPIIDLKINMERFTFLDRSGEFASFRLYAHQNEFGLHNIELSYPDGVLKGNVTIHVREELPHLSLNLEIPFLDTVYFSADGEHFGDTWADPTTPEKRWSSNLFDFGWMIGVTADANLVINRLIHHNNEYSRFYMQSALAGEQLRIDRLSFERLGGKIDLSGTLTGGKVPGLSCSFTVFNADIVQILHTFSSIDSLTGRLSISGMMTTSGINFLEWIKQMDAKLVIAGRGVRVGNFNIVGVTDAVLASRSVAEVVTNVSKVLDSGSTDFSVDGNLNLSNGIVRTPGIALRVGDIVGNLIGEWHLLSWKMALNAVFHMKTLQSETVPTLTVDAKGTPETYETRIDTTSLEAFVAKRIVGK